MRITNSISTTLLDSIKEHLKVFPRPRILGFRKEKSLKDHLVRTLIGILNNALGSESCEKRSCQVC